ncbi:replication initiation protein [Thiothrix nivea]|uniref:Initiator RepB protein n=1 Tax=Thiothrix nivea (strain ATCC 35100 / DSM 5205 / JP2) TaxID=870187 RepID=A0A656HJC8_THINJ|nr:replication initiation protein [Thiothrix nivea]EIJ37028.1 initiator RepB protein [Thiothrix nivea DSM 5205]
MFSMKPKAAAVTSLQVIRKSNELIEARYRLSIWEQRLVLTLLTQISPKDEDFKRYKIGISDLANLWELDGNYANAIYEEVQNAADSLVGRTIQLSDDPAISETVSWLSYVKYRRGSGEVEMEFHSSLKPYLLQLQKHFTQYQLGHVVNFKKQYTIRIYELLKMEAFKATGGSFSKTFKYTELRVLLALDEKEYKMFNDFKKRIIDPSVQEICAHTDLNIVDVRYGKTSRKITDITFVVKVRPADEAITLELEMEEPPKEHPIVEILINLGFASETARKYKTRFGVKCIERNIAYAKAKQEAGLVKDFPSYLNQAIKEDMGGAWEIAQAKQEQDNAEKQAQAARREQQAELAHLQKLAEQAGIPLETLLPKKRKGGEQPENSSKP